MQKVLEDAAALQRLTRERRTLLFADLAQSVRLMNAAEVDVIARWLRFVAQVQDIVLPSHGGRLVKSHGDALLLEFSSVRSAVLAAFELLRQIQQVSGVGGPDSAMRLRIGIHAADIVVQALDVFGAGVNLAARLATLADAGEIVVSTEVRDQLNDQPDWHLFDMGECFLKHFDQPVRAYRICAGAPPATPGIDLLDHRPALAVVPFLPRTPDDGPDALGDAIADDVIAALSNQRTLRVISRLSTVALRAATATQVGALVHATYLLSGTYRRVGNGVQLAVQLTETRAGTVLWTDQLQAQVADIFLGQDSLVPTIVGCIGRQVLRSEVERARALPITSLDDYTLYVASIAMLHRLAPRDFQHAHALLEHLRERHPRSAAPRAMLAKWHVLELAQGWSADRRRSGMQAQDHARRALDLDPDHALALAMQAAAIAHVGGDLAQAHELSHQSTEANPQEPHAWLTLGAVHSWLGNSAPAEELPLRAVALSPIDPARFLFDVFVAAGKLAVAKYSEAADAARASIRLNAMHTPSHRLLTIALVLGGNIEQGREAARRMLQVEPGFRVSDYASRYAGRDQPHAALRLKALLDAGVPN